MTAPYGGPFYAPPPPRKGWALVGPVLGITAAVLLVVAGLVCVAYVVIFTVAFSQLGNNK